MNNKLNSFLARAKKIPELGFVEAINVDRFFKDNNTSEFGTFSVNGFSPNLTISNIPISKKLNKNKNTLKKIEELKSNSKEAYIQAFQELEGIEIETLNLLYANYLAEQHDYIAWKYFFNKYLISRKGFKINLKSFVFDNIFEVIESEKSVIKQESELVSVIMPSYNSEKTISYAIESILNQTHQNIELIIVDDCSTDNTEKICKEFISKDSRIKFIKNKQNSGAYISRNNGLKIANGDYITILDADDFSFAERITYQLERIKETKAKAHLGYYLRINEKGKFVSFRITGKFSYDGALHKCLASMMIEKKFFDEVLGYWDSVRFGADSELYYRILAIDEKLIVEDIVPLYLALDRENSLTNSEETKIGGELRSQYAKAFLDFHKNSTVENLYYTFPQIKRPFVVPKEMELDTDISHFYNDDGLKLDKHMQSNINNYQKDEISIAFPDNIFCFSYFTGLPERYFQGYCFVGSSYIFGDEGARAYIKDTKKNITPGEDGCYFVINKQDNSFILGADYNGYKKIFLYREGVKWAVSNSLITLKKHLLNNGIELKPNYSQLEALCLNVNSTEPITGEINCFKTIFESVEFLPSWNYLVVDNNNIHIKAMDRKTKSYGSYDSALKKLVVTWVSRFITLLKHKNIHVTLDLTGGIDSRVIFSLYMKAKSIAESEGCSNIFDIRTGLGKRWEKDYSVAKKITDFYNLKLNNTSRNFKAKLFSSSEKFELWKHLNLGIYNAVYFPYHKQKYDVIRIQGGGAENYRKFYSFTPDEYLKSKIGKFSSEDNYNKYVLEFKETINTLISKNEHLIDPMILHYREFRSRTHAGRSPNITTSIAPFASRTFDDCASFLDNNALNRGQINFDVMESCLKGIIDFPYDNKKKTPGSDILLNLNTVSIAREDIQRGEVYAEKSKTHVDNTVTNTKDIEFDLLKKELIAFLSTSPLVYKETFNDGIRNIDRAIDNGKFNHAVDGSSCTAALSIGYALSSEMIKNAGHNRNISNIENNKQINIDTKKVFLLGTCRLHRLLIKNSKGQIIDNTDQRLTIEYPKIGFFHTLPEILQIIKWVKRDVNIPSNLAKYIFRKENPSTTPQNEFDESLEKAIKENQLIESPKMDLKEIDYFIFEICSLKAYFDTESKLYFHANPNFAGNIAYNQIPKEGIYSKNALNIPSVENQFQSTDLMEKHFSELFKIIDPQKTIIFGHLLDPNNPNQARKEVNDVLNTMSKKYKFHYIDTSIFVKKYGFNEVNGKIDIHNLTNEGEIKLGQHIQSYILNNLQNKDGGIMKLSTFL